MKGLFAGNFVSNCIVHRKWMCRKRCGSSLPTLGCNHQKVSVSNLLLKVTSEWMNTAKRKTVKLMKTQFSPNLMAFIFSKLSTGWRGVFASDDRVEQRYKLIPDPSCGTPQNHQNVFIEEKLNLPALWCINIQHSSWAKSIRPDLSLSLLVIINHIFTHYKASKHHQRDFLF